MYIADIKVEDKECTIFVSGCNHTCDCDSKYREFGVGKYMQVDDIIQELQNKVFDTLTITGGDLLCQPLGEAIRTAADLRLKYPHIDMTLYTGIKGRIPRWAYQYFDNVKKCKPKGEKNGN